MMNNVLFVQSLLRAARLTRGVLFVNADGFQLLSRPADVTRRVTLFSFITKTLQF
jgi:hypothetical protein